jgi:hypothetical protein
MRMTLQLERAKKRDAFRVPSVSLRAVFTKLSALVTSTLA